MHAHIYTHIYVEMCRYVHAHTCKYLKVIYTHSQATHAFERDFASVLICPLSHCCSCCCFYILTLFFAFFVENKSIGNAAIAKLSQRPKALVRSAIRFTLMVFLLACMRVFVCVCV